LEITAQIPPPPFTKGGEWGDLDRLTKMTIYLVGLYQHDDIS